MRSFARSMLIVTGFVFCAAAVPGCGGPTSPGADAGESTDSGTPGADAGNQVADAGTNNGSDGGTFVAGTTHHQNYVPADEHPTAATRLIVMGDSISAGYGTTDPANPSSMDTALAYYSLLISNDNTQWPKEMATNLETLFNMPSIAVTNVAVPGATTTDMANSQPGAITSALGMTVTGHSIVVITIGGNDYLQAVQASFMPATSATAFDMAQTTAITNITNVITYLQNKTQFPDGVSIYLADVYDPTDGSGVLNGACLGQPSFMIKSTKAVTALTDLRTAYISLATQMDFAIVDALGHFHGHGLYATGMTNNDYYDAADPNTWFAPDCIHPNDPGHNEMRRIFFEAITSGSYIATED